MNERNDGGDVSKPMHFSCEETASQIENISEEAFFVLKLQRLSYYCDDSEIYRLLTCSGSGVDAKTFNSQLDRQCCEGKFQTDQVDLFVPIRVNNVLFAYIIRFRERVSTYIIFSTGWQLNMEKWRLCLKQDINADGWHSGLYTMYSLFKVELFQALQKLHSLQSATVDWSEPIHYFSFLHCPLTVSGLSAGSSLAGMFVHDLLTTHYPHYSNRIHLYLLDPHGLLLLKSCVGSMRKWNPNN